LCFGLDLTFGLCNLGFERICISIASLLYLYYISTVSPLYLQ